MFGRRLWTLVVATVIATLCLPHGDQRPLVIYNHSPSIPVGYYVRVGEAPRRGSIVTVRAVDVAPNEARLRHFAGRRDLFIKRVAATAGEQVCASADVVAINGRSVALRNSNDSSGRSLPRWEGCRRLREDEFFLLGDAANSFDGRYWGSVRERQIEGVWRRL